MSEEHTKGDLWKLEKWSNVSKNVVVQEFSRLGFIVGVTAQLSKDDFMSSGEGICALLPSGKEEANARLIAAAPDLLETCELLLKTLLEAGFDPDISIVVEQAKAVIAKATK